MKAITESGRRSRSWLRQQGLAVRGLLRAAVLAGVLQTLAIIVQMGLIAWLVHALLIVGLPFTSLFWPAGGLLLAIILRAFAQAAQERCGQHASARVRQQVREQLAADWSLLGPVRLADRSSAMLTNQWVEQVEALDGYYARYLPQQWLALLSPLLILLLVFWLDWLAALFLLLAAPLIPLFMALIGMSAEKISQQHVLEAGRLAGHFLDRVRSLTSLQLFGQTGAATASIRDAAERYRSVTMRTLRVAFLSSAVLEFFASVAIAVVAMYIGFGLLGYIDYGPAGQLTLFSGLLILLLAPEFFQPLRSLAQSYHDRAAALGAADGMAALQVEAASVARPQMVVSGSDDSLVQISGLSLDYPGRDRALDQVSLDIRRAEVVALVGPSGSGKSSLLHCLAGFVTPTTGAISLFGQSPGQQPLAWLGQQPFLIKGSWAENLRLTAPQADTSALLQAIEAVGLSALLAAQPQGLDTLLGEGGRGLSGGQAQRLALARVWLSDAPLVLLDEPTASLDEHSEGAVIVALRALAASGRTLVIATHHPSLMALASRRYHLEKGRLADV
ncbi:thiol reductant ABC exporter subunit CydD [Pseudomonas neustonica]|uniref:Thiol reductant ABC exporter subunit CydD n=1 Tax=Pseudomonas neustonica TaxID=2487346 RepID=A0ABX9XFU6_9PSED|nr:MULTISPECIES: thiol reductant ABC exporter subunit CydD [Pseudomonas]ROZ81504.1 thiol reductant ABC exporter subunit CydD [Pseudomonas sp. SSM44]ROZ82958.1 thiol reductant ABC exporter subunit CydD [Pseudomonas neustonica]